MSIRRCTWMLLAAALPLSACGGSLFQSSALQPSSPESTVQTEVPGAPVVVQNESGKTICYVNISNSESGHWGPDRLAMQETVAPGQQRAWSLDSGQQWDVRLKDCRHNTVFERRSVAVDSNSVVLKYQ